MSSRNQGTLSLRYFRQDTAAIMKVSLALAPGVPMGCALPWKWSGMQWKWHAVECSGGGRALVAVTGTASSSQWQSMAVTTFNGPTNRGDGVRRDGGAGGNLADGGGVGVDDRAAVVGTTRA